MIRQQEAEFVKERHEEQQQAVPGTVLSHNPARPVRAIATGNMPKEATASAAPRAMLPQRPSRGVLRFFDLYLSLYVPFHFRALRLAHPERFPREASPRTCPVIICINHPSWWDPLTSILLSRFLLREADHYAPIDAVSLPRYRILSKLGLFPVEQGTPRGAVQFLRGAQQILALPNSLLWLTAQGAFTDVRTRPVVFKSGLAALIRRLDHVTVVPLAYEYTFWNERLPEILTSCGQPLVFTRGRLVDRPASRQEDAGEIIAAALATTQDELATLAATRDTASFVTVLGDHDGAGSLRARWRGLRAALRAKPYQGPLATPASHPQQP